MTTAWVFLAPGHDPTAAVSVALTPAALAALVGGELRRAGAGGLLTGMAALDEAGPEDVSFFGNEKYRPQLGSTRAGAVLTTGGESDVPAASAWVVVANPSLAFAAVVRHFAAAARVFRPGIDPRAAVAGDAVLDPAKVAVGPGAVIGAASVVGDGTAIGPNVVIGERVRIGRDCVIHPNVTVREGCQLGDRVILQPGVVIGSDGFGYEQSGGRHLKIDQVGIVVLGDDVEVGANTTIDRARFGRTVIGEGTKIDNLVQVAHNVVIGRHCLLVSQTGVAGSSRLGDGVVAAAQVGVAGHVRVGDGAVLTARTGVTADLEGGRTYAGKPARPLMEEHRALALARRLPQLVERLKALEQQARGGGCPDHCGPPVRAAREGRADDPGTAGHAAETC